MLFPLCVKITGETVKNLRLHFNKDDFSITVANRIAYISTSKYIYSYENDPSHQALPQISVNLLVGPNEELSEYSYIKTEQLLIDNVFVAANPVVMPTNEEVKQKKDTIVSSVPDYYPQNLVNYTGCHIINGYKCLSFTICPFRYDNANRRLYMVQDFTFKLSLQTSVMNENVKIQHNDSTFIKSLVANPEDINLYDKYNVIKGQSAKTNSQYEYVIITNNNLKPVFQKLAKWKTQKGIKTTVLTVENIYATYSGNTRQIKIKKALKNLYNNCSTFKYALLAGDVDIVPAQMCLVRFENSATPPTIYANYCPTDLYYACFGTMNWDTNGNGISGEVEDNLNISPDIAITRAPVSSINDAEAFVDRIISYESAPNAQTWANNILMCGNVMGSLYDYNGIIMSDTHYKGEKFYTDYIANYWSGSKVSFYDTGTDFPGGANYAFSPQNIQKELSKGYTFINVDTHGSPTTWQTEVFSYPKSYADTLNNSNQTIIITSACYTNAFDSIPECLSEAFVRNENSGIVAYFGCSRYGWYYPDQYSIGPSNIVNANLYNHIFNDNSNNYGEIVRLVKASMLPFCNSYYDVNRWLLFGLNPIGDPEMPIFTNVPQKFTNVSISYTNGTLTVNTGVSDCKICVASTNDMGDSYYDIRNGTSASFSNLTDEYSICVTKKGYIPYIAKCGNTVYMQNESINRDYELYSNQTIAGSNVTTNVSSGPVKINKGKTTIKGTNGVTINDSFEVKNGASIEIRAN